jgi:hypothetical protein
MKEYPEKIVILYPNDNKTCFSEKETGKKDHSITLKIILVPTR